MKDFAIAMAIFVCFYIAGILVSDSFLFGWISHFLATVTFGLVFAKPK